MSHKTKKIQTDAKGSGIASLGSHVKEMVMAYLTPHVTRSTKCTFSWPDVNSRIRPVHRNV